MAKVVAMKGLSPHWTVGLLSRVSTAIETPFSFIPSRQMKGATRQDILSLNVIGFLMPMLSIAAKAIDLNPFFGRQRTIIEEVSNLKS